MEKLLDLFHHNPDLFTDILESINDAIYITDQEGTTLWINTVSESMFRLSKHEIIGRNVKDLEKEGVFKPSVIRKALKAGKNVSAVQEVAVGRRYIATGHLVKDKNEKIIAAVAHCRDITEVVKNTTKLQEIEELLEKYSTYIRKLTNNKVKYNNFWKSDSRVVTEKFIGKIAEVDTTALIVGETGTGKSLMAKKIHMFSKRKSRPFVEINCASIPESLMESELFGYEKGSFTGATSKGKAGLIQSAEGGTLLLDEVGELPLQLQAKILHFLQSKTYFPIGARVPQKADVRIIAATNRDLESMVSEGTFRSDLFYRMNVLTVKIPALRESREDIESLTKYYLNLFNNTHHKRKRIADGVFKIFLQYSWPGNIRELENLIERLVILSEEEVIEEKDLPQKMVKQNIHFDVSNHLRNATMPEILEETERKMIIDALEKEKSTRKAAKFLGVTQSLLMRRIRKYNIQLVVEESKTFVKQEVK
ncbi:sigma-54-dependent Fis family transcriptional regulator [Oceanobacillus sp. J11TS1]|uniref:sigma-54 interaction domain-containing protein n=1 Tax=Oceanobacillus sp. J11TS1 TaxID=2807191 RepID=UPI001B137CDB|nr:sigma 54-interacting transcriptional regulator [Oceanobacillus sp. J11TS1]GIO24135.1 RNA polymerase subunit sigma-54 [Oceanobacillus sp. J11TS1]